MKKVVLALIALVALVSSDSFASCRRSCGYVEKKTCNRPYVSRVEEQPCGPAPCCITAVKMPADLVQEITYRWECPNGCTAQNADFQ